MPSARSHCSLPVRPGALVFGSEIEPLVQFPGFDRTFNIEALGHYLLNRYVPGPATFFRAVKKLQPGHYAVWRGGQPYRQPAISRLPLPTRSPTSRHSRTPCGCSTTTFDEAVQIRMRSDAPFGAYLSGGIDSSAVVATMVKTQLRARANVLSRLSRGGVFRARSRAHRCRAVWHRSSGIGGRTWRLHGRLADCRAAPWSAGERSLRYSDLHAFEIGLPQREDGVDG